MKKFMKLVIVFIAVMFIGMNVYKANVKCPEGETEIQTPEGYKCTYLANDDHSCRESNHNLENDTNCTYVIISPYIKFDTNYRGFVCHVGETIAATLHFSPSQERTASVLDPSIGSIELSTDLQLNCADCQIYKIKCLSAGTTNVSVSFPSGEAASVALRVFDTSVPIKTITFDANGGKLNIDTESFDTYTIKAGETEKFHDATWQISAKKDGKVFRGWYTSPTGGELVYGRNFLMTTNDMLISSVSANTLYAHYADGICAKGFELDGGNYVSPETVRCEINNTTNEEFCNFSFYGDTYGDSLPEVFKEGYKFVGWYTEKEGGNLVKSTDIVPSIPKITLYARFVEEGNLHTITYDSNGGTACTPATHSVNEGESWGTLCTPTRKGYKFNGWFTQKTGGARVNSDDLAQSDITVYAQWRANTTDTNVKTGIFTPIISIVILGLISTLVFFIVMKRNKSL